MLNKLKLWILSKIFGLFQKYWSYSEHYVDVAGDLVLVFRNNLGDQILSIPKHRRLETTHIHAPGKYLAVPHRIDTGWVFSELVLSSQKSVTLYVCARERKEYYLKNFKQIQKDKPLMRRVNFDMDLVMDLDITVLGDGAGLSQKERAEIVQVLKSLNY